ncbi:MULTISPECIES: restriction endonuclease subunit S [unclassified Microcystis]|jgi:type I restriction enzyme S subunit|uniref:Restriction endonuclease subunit S n=1 Tax=Microcystis flos-aquae Mf_QC_C_20070823_S10D TaxID=2486236 RepID=A0A552KJ21_9CHRO|nr:MULTISPECIES: restriction endonuclease subunit S [unclassified Microcystis]MCA2817567.1 restriction endonuclease subunit S [Microcystis sp. M085S1]MCA2857092.1 restriction endonuclease subunit S [Microcystis sp. M065S1]TRT79210.1 MAG: restriction endonuclease subunit S [Microcystis flos-aquae Ma_QC_C_20070823_S18]TRT94023.1 MAG: restriction endonuclease subunit S [Microcystis flos-aquae Ma_QC_C_20070823_S18D]TRV07991.1 MAG: restriction endonuclease subunit S [Microcystis flos-aquae Mf_QC_C_
MSQENDRQLPDGWQWVKLRDVCKIVNGSTPSSTIEEYWNGDIIWITPTDLGKLSSSLITDAARKITKSGYQSCNTEIVPTNSVIISSRAPIGYIGIANIPLCTNQGCKSLVVTEKIDTWFLYFWLKLSIPVLKSIGKGTTFQEISKSQLTIFEIPLPPLSEQKRIAAILNEQMEAVEKARKATEAQLEAAKALPAAYLRAVFESEEANSWERRKLGDVCRVTKLAGFEYTKYVNYNPDGKYIALRAQNVRNTGLDLSNFVKITEDVASYLSRSKLDSGDIVMTFIGANIGEATWIDKNDMFYCAPNIARITPNAELIDCQFLTRLIHSSEFQRQIRDINESTAQQSLSMKNIRDFWVVFPTLSQQKQIASTLTEQMQEVERLKQNLKEQLDTINKLPAVLLRRAFNGEL